MFNNQNILAHYFGSLPVIAVYYNDKLVYPGGINITGVGPYVFKIDTSKSNPTDDFFIPTQPTSETTLYYNISVDWGD